MWTQENNYKQGDSEKLLTYDVDEYFTLLRRLMHFLFAASVGVCPFEFCSDRIYTAFNTFFFMFLATVVAEEDSIPYIPVTPCQSIAKMTLYSPVLSLNLCFQQL